MRTRAYYRYRHRIAERKARRIVEHIWRGRDTEAADRITQGMVRNRRRCSCWMCCRSRRVLGPSAQEMRQPQWHLTYTCVTDAKPGADGYVWVAR